MIKRTGKEFREWAEYFRRHLGGEPWAFKSLLDGTIAEMTVPEQVPQWFDPSFTPTPNYVVPIQFEAGDPDDVRREGAIARYVAARLKQTDDERLRATATGRTSRAPTTEEVAAKYGPPKASPQLDAILRGKKHER